jgi:tetratricopeptide (TPR) repeat protein
VSKVSPPPVPGNGRSDGGQAGAGAASIDLSGSSGVLIEALAERLHAAEATAGLTWRQLPDSARRVWRSRAAAALKAIRELELVPDGPASGDPNDGNRLDASLFIEQAEALLRVGEPLMAYNQVQLGLDRFPEHVRLRQLEGLALARSGALRRANKALRRLHDAGAIDGETLGLLARTHKDLGLAAARPEIRERHLAAAFRIYEHAYQSALDGGEQDHAFYNGVNAAALAVLREQLDRARGIALQVHELCSDLVTADPAADQDYWLRATLGETSLILGDLKAAEREYSAAFRHAGRRYGDLSRTRQQAKLLLETMGQESGWLDAILTVPPVLLFSGHMVDKPRRAQPRFPPGMEAEVAGRIRDAVNAIGPAAAYGSAACGADILCLEAVRDAGGELHVVLPFPAEDFRRVCVDFPGSGNWGERFDRLLETAVSVHVISDHFATGSDSTFEYANLVLTGLGKLRARMLETSAVGLAVWDGHPGDGPVGTASMIQAWRRHQVETRIVHMPVPDTAADLTDAAAAPPDGDRDDSPRLPRPPSSAPRPGFSHEMKAMLFADAVGYSKLTEDQIPVFIEQFLGEIGRLRLNSANAPIHVETAGDGLYMVFEQVGAAGRFALEFNAAIGGRDWRDAGLPASMGVRIALHCGPVFCTRDPITGNPMYTGPHTSRTARIEPITPVGQVYASGAFAAVATAMDVTDLRFSYIGRAQLAKKHGSLALYHVRMARPMA